MDNKEYIILSKTALEKMREELNKGCAHLDGVYVSNYQNGQIDLIDVIISSKSTPLIPELKKAFEAGAKIKWEGKLLRKAELETQKQNYIANLKLDP